ncbi:hypothetical protein [Amycolatopsis sp. WAC 04197]|uniref:hypothetical protein n=1 Tax=Amycolatopsis sp. WAC 04197 TaxID=2203199 RepID=UPI000F7660E4|nr:hypothetical protein [Amycolatopsis sp. WAC 04197]
MKINSRCRFGDFANRFNSRADLEGMKSDVPLWVALLVPAVGFLGVLAGQWLTSRRDALGRREQRKLARTETYAEFYQSVVKLVDNVEHARRDKFGASGQAVVRKYFPLSIVASRSVDWAAAKLAVKAGSLTSDQAISDADVKALETDLSDMAAVVLKRMKSDLDGEHRGWVYPLCGWVRHPGWSAQRLKLRVQDRWGGFKTELEDESKARPVVEGPEKHDVARVTHAADPQPS